MGYCSVGKPLETAILDRMCRGRGLDFDRFNPVDDLLLPPSGNRADNDAYRSLLDHYAVRLLLKEIIKAEDPDAWIKGRRSVERFCHPEALDSYLESLKELGILRDSGKGNPIVSVPVRNFGATYEWYVARVLSTDFHCPSVWGARFADMDSGGDHDVISSVSGRLMYLEVKTAPPKHIEMPEISGFIHRLWDVAPDIAVFHNDTHLRMKDKIVPLLEEGIKEFKKTSKVQTPMSKKRPIPTFNVKLSTFNGKDAGFERLEREIFHLDSCLYVINSKPDLKRNLSAVFRHYFRKGNPILEVLT